MPITFDPSTESVGVALSNGDLTATWTGSAGPDGGVIGFAADQISSGKYYFEVTVNTFTGSDNGVGIAAPSVSYPSFGNDGTAGVALFPSANLWINGSNSGAIALGGIPSGHVVGFAADFTAHKIWVKDITGGGDWNADVSADPATGTNGRTIPSFSFVPAIVFNGSAFTQQATFNMGATSFTGATPSGFISWDGSLFPSGVWNSTEATDAFSAVGYSGIPGPHGNLSVTEAQDIFAAIGSPTAVGIFIVTEPQDHFSAFGFQPLTATFNVTEAPDRMHATGIGLGEDGVFIATEAVDIFAAVGNTPISGSFDTTESPDRFTALGAGVTRVRRRRVFTVT